MTPFSCISVDMDSVACYTAIHGLDAPDPNDPDPIWTTALDRFLDLFDAAGVRATFFCVGADLEHPEHAAQARKALAAGHEIASHSQEHLYDLRSRGEGAIRRDIARAESSIEAAVGCRPVGFRTPGYNISPTIARILVDRGYAYDSSLFPCLPYYAAKGLIMGRMKLRGEPSRSQMTLPWTLVGPTVPYMADPDRPWRRQQPGRRALFEVPMALVPGLRFPLIGTSLHLLGGRGFRALLPLVRAAHPELFNLEFHGIDLLDTTDQGLPPLLFERQPDLRIKTLDKHRLYHQIFDWLGHTYQHRPLAEAVEHMRMTLDKTLPTC